MNKSHTPPSHSTMRVCAIVINWNSFDDTALALRKIFDSDHPPIRITVVDNGSTDNSLARLKDAFPQARYHALPQNTGFGYANNVGLREAIAENIPYAWLINNDAYPEPEALSRMIQAMEEHPDAGACGAVVMEMDRPDRIQAVGGGRYHSWLAYAPLNTSPRQRLDFITGCCMLLRTCALDEVGLFDETFFLYWEDTDLCIRLRRAGWRLIVADARVWHRGSASTARNPRRRSQNLICSYRILAGKHERWAWVKSFTAALFQSTIKALRGNFEAARGCWEGWRLGRS